MLKIELVSKGTPGLNFNQLQQLDIPKPINGISEEINQNAVLAFEDENDAINYRNQMDAFAAQQPDKSTIEYAAAQLIIEAITNDAFVTTFERETD